MRTISVTPIVKSYDNIICKENDEIKITFEALQEDITPDFEEPYLSKFLKKLDNDFDFRYSGVSANWFCAKVTVKYKDFEGTDYLGACSYKSYNQFCKLKNHYFSDMVSRCVEEINTAIIDKNAETRQRLEVRKNLMKSGVYQQFIQNFNQLRSILS